MKLKPLLPVLVLITLVCGFAFYAWSTRTQLPPRVATHFDLHGQANGWMTNAGHFRFMISFGLGLPLFFVLVFHAPRFVAARFVNLPHREQWLAGDRRAETLRWISTFGTWFACLFLLFMASVQHLILDANTHRPPRLDNGRLLLAIGLLLTCELALVLRLIFRFAKPPQG